MRLIITDLDGTLLNEKSMVSDRTKNTIQKLLKQGVNFAIATGRGIISAKKYKDVIGSDIYLICNNGATIYNTNEEKIYEKVLSQKEVEIVVKYFREKNIIYNGVYEGKIFTDDGAKDSIKTIETGFQHIGMTTLDEFPVMTKILVKDKTETIIELMNDMKEKFSDFLDITMSSPICLDIVHKECNKGNGVKLISKLLDIPTDEIMVFGDGGNDLGMLEIVGHPVVMENGLDSLKEKIKNIAPSNKEDGVAQYLEKFFE